MRVSSSKSEGGWRVKPCLFDSASLSGPCERPLVAKATIFFIFVFSAEAKGATFAQSEMRLLTSVLRKAKAPKGDF